MIENLIYITLIVVGVFYSGFPAEIESMINSYLKRKGSVGTFRIPKPFGCQLCMTFWCTLIYTIVIGRFSLANTAVCLGFALSTTAVEYAIRLILETVETLLVKIGEYINS